MDNSYKQPTAPNACLHTFSFLKKGGGWGGWVEKIQGHRPTNRLCIGCGAVWQMWCHWWCGVARVVGGMEGWAGPATP